MDDNWAEVRWRMEQILDSERAHRQARHRQQPSFWQSLRQCLYCFTTSTLLCVRLHRDHLDVAQLARQILPIFRFCLLTNVVNIVVQG